MAGENRKTIYQDITSGADAPQRYEETNKGMHEMHKLRWYRADSVLRYKDAFYMRTEGEYNGLQRHVEHAEYRI